jgi:hypothetical protein
MDITIAFDQTLSIHLDFVKLGSG